MIQFIARFFSCKEIFYFTQSREATKREEVSHYNLSVFATLREIHQPKPGFCAFASNCFSQVSHRSNRKLHPSVFTLCFCSCIHKKLFVDISCGSLNSILPDSSLCKVRLHRKSPVKGKIAFVGSVVLKTCISVECNFHFGI